MKRTLTFNRSLYKSTQSKINVDIWDKCVNAYDNKQYLKSFQLLLDYINPELKKKYANETKTEYVIPHGTITLTLKYDDDKFSVTAPFVRVPENNKIALMRQVASINFNELYLAQIVLKGDELHFQYTCPSDLIHPGKLYYVFKEICTYGDKYGAEFASKFNAPYINVPKITPFDAKSIDKAYDVVQQSCKECNDAIKFFENDRKFGFAWNIIDSTLMKILYFAHPKGQLHNDISKAIFDMDKDDIQLIECNAIGKKMVERLQAMSKEELSKYLYNDETFVSYKNRSSLQNIQDNFSSNFGKIQGYFSQGDYMSVCLIATYQLYSMYLYNDVQNNVNRLVVSALKASSGKTWEKAADPLYKAIARIMYGDLTPIVGINLGGGLVELFSTLIHKIKNR